MKQHRALTAIVVEDDDEAIDIYGGKRGFVLVEDSYLPEQSKRWVVLRRAVQSTIA